MNAPQRNGRINMALILMIVALVLLVMWLAKVFQWDDELPTVFLIIFGSLAVVAGNHQLKWYVLDEYYNSVEKREISTTNIYSMHSFGNVVEGSFVLGFGKVEGKPVFHAFTSQKDGAKKVLHIPMDYPIYEDATPTTASLRKKVSWYACEKVSEAPWWTHVLWPVHCWGTPATDSHSIHIPPNSIQVRYDL